MFWKLLTCQIAVAAMAAIATAAAYASIGGQVESYRSAGFFGFLAGLLVAVAASWLLARRWTRRIHSATRAVSTLPWDNSHDDLLGLDAQDAIGELTRALDQARKRLSDQIRGIDRVRQDLQSMLETIPEAVIAIDAQQKVLFANPSTFRLFELHDREIAGRKLWEVIRQPGLQDAVTMTFASTEPTNTEFEMRQPPRIVSFRGRSLSVGSGRGIILVLNDVTELRRLERMRQDFFASVSHELKTPLAAIKAYSETLLDDDSHDPPVIRRFLLRIEEQADRLHELVIDMLMLARVESEDHGFDIQPTEIGPVVTSSLEPYRREAEAKCVELIAQIDSTAGTVLADHEGLGMIIRNLVDNAIKYTPTGGRVTVCVNREEGNVLVRVQDTGVGIPPEDLSRIFERFYRVDKARSRELGGTGLGLSIVKHLVQRFGGHVIVRSRMNEGSEFRVSLPAWPHRATPDRRVRAQMESSL